MPVPDAKQTKINITSRRHIRRRQKPPIDELLEIHRLVGFSCSEKQTSTCYIKFTEHFTEQPSASPHPRRPHLRAHTTTSHEALLSDHNIYVLATETIPCLPGHWRSSRALYHGRLSQEHPHVEGGHGLKALSSSVVSSSERLGVSLYSHHGAPARAGLTSWWTESLRSSTESAQPSHIDAAPRAQEDQQR